MIKGTAHGKRGFRLTNYFLKSWFVYGVWFMQSVSLQYTSLKIGHTWQSMQNGFHVEIYTIYPMSRERACLCSGVVANLLFGWIFFLLEKSDNSMKWTNYINSMTEAELIWYFNYKF